MIAYKKQSSRNKRASEAENIAAQASLPPATIEVETVEEGYSSDSSLEKPRSAQRAVPPKKARITKADASTSALSSAVAAAMVGATESSKASRAVAVTATASSSSTLVDANDIVPSLVQGQPISVEQKVWLATQVNTGKLSAYELHKESKVAARSVYRYAYKLRKGLVIREKSGRPPALDEESENMVLNLLKENPNVERRVLIQFIRDQHMKTWHRRHSNHGSDLDPNTLQKPNKLSMRSIDRYLIRIMEIKDGKQVTEETEEAEEVGEQPLAGVLSAET